MLITTKTSILLKGMVGDTNEDEKKSREMMGGTNDDDEMIGMRVYIHPHLHFEIDSIEDQITAIQISVDVRHRVFLF